MNNNAYLTVRALIHNWESRERKTKVKIYKKNKKKLPKLRQAKINQIIFKSLNECSNALCIIALDSTLKLLFVFSLWEQMNSKLRSNKTVHLIPGRNNRKLCN